MKVRIDYTIELTDDEKKAFEAAGSPMLSDVREKLLTAAVTATTEIVEGTTAEYLKAEAKRLADLVKEMK